MSHSKKYLTLSVSELKTELEQLMKERFSLRMQKATGQAVKTHLMKQARINIARIKTILGAQGVKV